MTQKRGGGGKVHPVVLSVSGSGFSLCGSVRYLQDSLELALFHHINADVSTSHPKEGCIENTGH